MVHEVTFPEIQKYIPYLSKEEQEHFMREKNNQKDNKLNSQLEIISKIIESTSNPSEFLLFLLGKLLYNLSEWDKIEQKIKQYSYSLDFKYWLGIINFRQGKFAKAEEIFKELQESGDKFIKLEGTIGLARVAERKGEKNKARDLFKQVEDSINRELDQSKDTVFYDTLFRFAFGELWASRTDSNVEESKEKCIKYLELAKQYGNRLHIASFYMLLGILDKYQGDWESSRKHFNSARVLFRELGNIRGEITVVSNIADVDRMQGRIEDAQGRILSVLSYYQLWNDKRSEALVFFNLGQINAQKRRFKEAIEDFLKAKEILRGIDAKDENLNNALAELYIELKKWKEFSEIMGEIIEGKEKKEITQNPHIMYLYGKKEMQNLNLAKAQFYLDQALKVAGKKRMDHLGAKILVDILKVLMYDIGTKSNEQTLRECEKYIEDLRLFFRETKQEENFIFTLDEIEQYLKKIKKAKVPKEIRKLVLQTQKLIKELMDKIRYNIQGKELDVILPNQLIVLHRSGIPIKKYVREKLIVDDVLLFGGMVRAAKDIISEVFTSEIGKVMKMDYGESIKILAEFGEKETGIVMITTKDTFHQRRALHESVIELNEMEFPQQFHGELPEQTNQQIDKIIMKWFGKGYFEEKRE
ncbi:MAG: tetratricopeptide repeat protein [Candidatus Heimdallarchaeaceae archaeon]